MGRTGDCGVVWPRPASPRTNRLVWGARTPLEAIGLSRFPAAALKPPLRRRQPSDARSPRRRRSTLCHGATPPRQSARSQRSPLRESQALTSTKPSTLRPVRRVGPRAGVEFPVGASAPRQFDKMENIRAGRLGCSVPRIALLRALFPSSTPQAARRGKVNRESRTRSANVLGLRRTRRHVRSDHLADRSGAYRRHR